MALTTLLLPALLVGALLAAGAWLISRRVQLRPGAAVPDQMVAAMLFLLAFTLGLTVSSENSTLNAARSASSMEANSLAELYWFGHTIGEPEHSKVQALIRDYAKDVATVEWPLMAEHKTSPVANNAVGVLRENIDGWVPRTDKEKLFYPTALSDVSTLFNNRRNRVAIARSAGVPRILLYALTFLTVLGLIVMPLSGQLKDLRDLVLYGIFAALFVAALLFVNDLNNPFKGIVKIAPSDMQNLFKTTFHFLS